MTEYRAPTPLEHLQYRIAALERMRAMPGGCPRVILDEQHRMIRVALQRVMQGRSGVLGS